MFTIGENEMSSGIDISPGETTNIQSMAHVCGGEGDDMVEWHVTEYYVSSNIFP